MIFDAARVLIPFVISFVIGIATAPILTHYLFKYKAWKKKAGKGKGLGDDKGTPLFDDLHKEREVSTPRMGGILIWSSTLLTAGLLWLLAGLWEDPFGRFDFVDRGQTWLPLFALIVGGLFGLIDDMLEVTSGKFFNNVLPAINSKKGAQLAAALTVNGGETELMETPRATGGLSIRWRLLFVGVVGAFAGWWFFDKLDVSALGIPFVGPLELGFLFIPFFIFVMLAIYASGVIDGVDGLAGGVFAIIFLTYAGIAYGQEQVALAAFASTVAGSIFAFLWFNVPPARFYMSETGSMALTLALTVTAFSADVLGEGVGVSVLPIIALPLTVTVLTNVLQVIWKKVFKKKLFRIAPIHHHFETMGWPPYKVTMRYWIITIIAGIFGIAIALLK